MVVFKVKSAFCDRYTRIEGALKLFPDFHANVLPVEGCCPVSYSHDDSFTFGLDVKVKGMDKRFGPVVVANLHSSWEDKE